MFNAELNRMDTKFMENYHKWSDEKETKPDTVVQLWT